MAHENEQKFPSLLNDLYCEEEIDREDCFIEKESAVDDNVGSIEQPLLVLDQDLKWEVEELGFMLRKEQEIEFSSRFLEGNPSWKMARNQAVEWILNVSAYHSFSASTSVLAVSYLDIFLFKFQSINGDKKQPWMAQLAAVACLSLAAKIEETHVPLLLDLQVGESKYVFEAKTIGRMEILVLSTLQWRMNLVTPLSFVDYIARRLGLKNQTFLEFLKRCECLLLSIICDCSFICYLPSVMATATMLHAFTSFQPSLGVEYQEELVDVLGIDKDKVKDCYRLITKIIGLHLSNKRKFERGMPGSPTGVMEVSFSSDSSNDSWSVASSSVTSSPERFPKRACLVEDLLDHELVYHDATSHDLIIKQNP